MNPSSFTLPRKQFLIATMGGTFAYPALASQAPSSHGRMFKNLNGGHIGLKADLKQSILLAAEYGFEGVAPNLGAFMKMSAGQRREIKGLMRDKGLRWGASGLPVNFRKDDSAFRTSIAGFAQQAHVLNQMGVTRMATWIMPGHNEWTYLEQFNILKQRLGECAKMLQDHHIRLGLEFVAPRTIRRRFRFAFACTQKEMLELCDAIGTSNVGLLLDSWHWYTSHGTADELGQLANKDIVLVHVNDAPKGIPIDEQIDNKRGLPCTTGVIDMKSFIQALDRMGYDGPVECEPFDNALRNEVTQSKLQKTKAALDRVFDLI